LELLHIVEPKFGDEIIVGFAAGGGPYDLRLLEAHETRELVDEGRVDLGVMLIERG